MWLWGYRNYGRHQQWCSQIPSLLVPAGFFNWSYVFLFQEAEKQIEYWTGFSDIQQAIDDISDQPIDSNGFRGELLLAPGDYKIAADTGFRIRRSGVVVRGVAGEHDGSGKEKPIRLLCTSTKRSGGRCLLLDRIKQKVNRVKGRLKSRLLAASLPEA